MSRPRKATWLRRVSSDMHVACESCPESAELSQMSVVQPDDSSFDEWWCPACTVGGCELGTVPVEIQRGGGVKA